MMDALARVQRIEAGRVWLRVSDNGGGCGRCDEPGGCRAVQISHAFGKPADEFVLPAYGGARVGDRVRIRIPDGAPLKAALGSYGLGVVLLVAGAAAGTALASRELADLAAALGAGAGLALAVVINRGLSRSRRWRTSLDMELVAEQACLGPAADPVRES